MKVQWLLIGGSMNGQMHWAEKAEAKIDFNSIDGSKVETYGGLTYHLKGKRYRLGVSHPPKPLDPEKVESLIRKVRPQPIEDAR